MANLRAVYWSRFLEISDCLLAFNTMPKTVHPLVLVKVLDALPSPVKAHSLALFPEDLYTFQNGLHKVEIMGPFINLKECEQVF